MVNYTNTINDNKVTLSNSFFHFEIGKLSFNLYICGKVYFIHKKVPNQIIQKAKAESFEFKKYCRKIRTYLKYYLMLQILFLAVYIKLEIISLQRTFGSLTVDKLNSNQ